MKKKIMLIILALSVVIGCGVYAVYGENSSDITNDPLITLSYLNEDYWEKIEAAIAKAVNGSADYEPDDSEESSSEEDTESDTEIDTESDSETDTSVESDTEVTAPDTEPASFAYEVLHLKEGDIVLAETPCEIILRSGSATAYLSGNESGIADLTGGSDLKEGESLSANHHLLVPRGGDGRGFMVTSSEAYIMVRGGYNIVAEEIE